MNKIKHGLFMIYQIQNSQKSFRVNYRKIIIGLEY
jgi:hypothetical protein